MGMLTAINIVRCRFLLYGAGKINEIPRCDWLPDRVRWNDAARLEFPRFVPAIQVQAGTRKFSFPKYFPEQEKEFL